jgi:hypothetical protein
MHGQRQAELTPGGLREYTVALGMSLNEVAILAALSRLEIYGLVTRCARRSSSRAP